MYTIIGVHKALDKRKEAIADRIIRHGIENGKACISFQVVKKCLNTMLRKAEILLTAEQTRSYLKTILRHLFRVPTSIPCINGISTSKHAIATALRCPDYSSRPLHRLVPNLTVKTCSSINEAKD